MFGTFLVLKMTGVEDRGAGSVEVDAAFTRAFALAERFHLAMSRQDPASDLAALARSRPGEGVEVRSETMDVLALALALAEDSDGRFDPVERVGNGAAATWRDIKVAGPGCITLRHSLKLSLDGVAKGFAADRLCAILREAGNGDVVVDAGGDMALSCRTPQAVGIRNPKAPGRLARTVEMAKGGIAGSGPYGTQTTYWNKNGERQRARAVTTMAPSCAVADAMTKVALADPHAAVLGRWGARVI